METVQHVKTFKYFDAPDDDFEQFQNVFARYDTKNEDDALTEVSVAIDDLSFSREYTDDEIKSIFHLHAEYSGIDKEVAKDKVSPFSKRKKTEDELKAYVKCKSASKRKPITIESAKELIKILEAFDSYEFSHNN